MGKQTADAGEVVQVIRMQKPIFDEYDNYDFPTDVKLDEPNTMCWSVVNPISLLTFDIMGETDHRRGTEGANRPK